MRRCLQQRSPRAKLFSISCNSYVLPLSSARLAAMRTETPRALATHAHEMFSPSNPPSLTKALPSLSQRSALEFCFTPFDEPSLRKEKNYNFIIGMYESLLSLWQLQNKMYVTPSANLFLQKTMHSNNNDLRRPHFDTYFSLGQSTALNHSTVLRERNAKRKKRLYSWRPFGSERHCTLESNILVLVTSDDANCHGCTGSVAVSCRGVHCLG